MSVTAVRLGSDLEVKLTERARLLNISKSDFIRSAVEEKLERIESMDFQERNRHLIEFIKTLPAASTQITDEDIVAAKEAYMTERYFK